MINPFTLYAKVQNIQKSVMKPLYGNLNGYVSVNHDTLLYLTGMDIALHVEFIHEICNSSFIASCFKFVKLIGGAPQLTEEDFERFTNYVKDGGLEAMLKMLEAEDKFKAFEDELKVLPQRVRDNAELMLTKALVLHEDFVLHYAKKKYRGETPHSVMDNMVKTNNFISKLIQLSRE